MAINQYAYFDAIHNADKLKSTYWRQFNVER